MNQRPLTGERIDLDGGSVARWPCHIGTGASFGEGCSVGALAHVGQRVVMGDGCKIQGTAYIADDCVLGNRVFVGNDAVIGGNATVVPGNNVGEGAVLAAGAVLTKHLPSNEVWGGNPASFLMTREAYEARRGLIE